MYYLRLFVKVIAHSKPLIDDFDVLAVATQVESGMHSNGERVREFEDNVKKYIGVKHAKAVNSGTSALHLALLSLGVGKSDEVIIPSYVCMSVLSVVEQVEAKPVLVDVGEDMNISVGDIKLSNKTKAIIVPHMFGVPADIDKIISLGVPVIEDCALSLGAEYRGKKVGCFGSIGVFSFKATKMISTGHGGMIVTNSSEIKEKIDDLMEYDKREEYVKTFNYHMTDIQAALGISQLEKIDKFISRRREIGERYDKTFRDLIEIGKREEGSFPYRYIIQLKSSEERERLEKELSLKGISVSRPIFKPLHNYLGLVGFENCEKIHEEALSIPIYPALTDDEVDKVVEGVKGCFLR
jgi:perosamine synthetase